MDLSDVRHIAVIMDGNGRWAETRNLVRTRGHRAGVTSVRACATACARAGLHWLTLYALSTENFRSRPPGEIRKLMALLRRFMVGERPTIMENDIRLRTVGRVNELPRNVLKEVRRTEEMSANNRGMVLCLALNYGGRAEIADACRLLVEQAARGELRPEEVDEALLTACLYDPSMPDVDLLVRTASEQRISNFLLWQVSYAEIFVTPTLWPDFREAELAAALDAYRVRRRKFGGLLEGVDH